MVFSNIVLFCGEIEDGQIFIIKDKYRLNDAQTLKTPFHGVIMSGRDPKKLLVRSIGRLQGATHKQSARYIFYSFTCSTSHARQEVFAEGCANPVYPIFNTH